MRWNFIPRKCEHESGRSGERIRVIQNSVIVDLLTTSNEIL